MSDSRVRGDIIIDASTLAVAEMVVSGLEGELTFEWGAVDGTAMEKIVLFTIPAKLRIPLPVAGIPFSLDLGATLQAVPALTGQKASSGGKTTVAWRSDQGFSTTGNGLTGQGALLGSPTWGFDSAGSAGFGPVGMGVGFELPRLTLSIAGIPFAFVTVKTYLQSMFTPGTTLSSEIPPCQLFSANVRAAAGYKIPFLTIPLAASQTELWVSPDLTKYGDDTPCTLAGSCRRPPDASRRPTADFGTRNGARGGSCARP